MLLDGFLDVEAATTSSSQSELLCACDVTVEGPAAVERQAIAATAMYQGNFLGYRLSSVASVVGGSTG